ncbi:MAG TPA: class I SAM-dependent methyltransferase [Bacteroidota bacterium]|nr:class I SAM-dependent methyltransferase [Bacteroidota bacterium]
MFTYLASLTPAHDPVVDCARGNGQAAVGLATHFTRVIAIHRSADQLSHAVKHSRIEYHLRTAEQIDLPDHCADLLTGAQALHWFDLPAVYRDVRRVLEPDGVLAVWVYTLNRVDDDFDALVRHYHDEIVGPYWPEERRLVTDEYRSLPFPLREHTPPPIEMTTEWTPERILGYLHSWSARQRYIDRNGSNPIDLLADDLARAWGRTTVRSVSWPLSLRVGVLQES